MTPAAPVAPAAGITPATPAVTHLVPPLPGADTAALEAELAAALAAGDLHLDPEDYQACDLDPETLSLDDFTLESQLTSRYHAPTRSRILHPHLVRYENAQALAAALHQAGDLSQPGAHLHAVVNGNFIFGDFIEAWIKANNWLIPDLYLATLSYSQANVDSLANLLHGDYVQRLHLMVSDHFFAHERHRHGLINYAYQELDAYGGERFQLTVTVSHAKVTCLTPIDEVTGDPIGHYVLHGSANLRSSASIEQFAIEHDHALHAFHTEWLQALEAQYSTIYPHQPGPAAPKRSQWQQVQPTAPSTTAAPAPPSPTPPARPAPRKSAAWPKPAAAPSAPSNPAPTPAAPTGDRAPATLTPPP